MAISLLLKLADYTLASYKLDNYSVGLLNNRIQTCYFGHFNAWLSIRIDF